MSYDEDVSQTLTIAYTGDGVEGGSIDVRDLAPSLLALGELLEVANQTLYADASRISVRIRATGKGSFEVSLDIVMSLLQQITTFFSGDGSSGVLNLLAYLGLARQGHQGVVQLLKKLRGRRPETVVDNEDGTVVLVINGEKVGMPRDVVKLVQEPEVREAITKFISPLHRGDVSGIEVRNPGEESFVLVSPEDVELIEADFTHDEQEDVLESTTEAALTVLTISFQERNKWRFSDGDRAFWATMEDEGFQQAIDQRVEAFAKGDVLICLLRRRQTYSESGIKSEYAVEKVLDHKRTMKQLRLLPERGGEISGEPAKSAATLENPAADIVSKIAEQGQEFFLPYFVDVVRDYPSGLSMGEVINEIRRRVLEDHGVDIDDAGLFGQRPQGEPHPRQLIRNLQSNKRLEGLVVAQLESNGRYTYRPIPSNESTDD